jgi:hypothetical protein
MVLLNKTLMNNLWMEDQMVLVTLSENQNALITNINRTDTIRSMHDMTFITWIVGIRLYTATTERANERVPIRDQTLVESMRRGKDGNKHAKMN